MPSDKGNACLYCINCMKFGQLILRKIIKIIATICQILSLKCTKFDFGWGSTQTPLGELTAPTVPLAGFKGGAWRQGGKGEGRKGRERVTWPNLKMFDPLITFERIQLSASNLIQRRSSGGARIWSLGVVATVLPFPRPSFLIPSPPHSMSCPIPLLPFWTKKTPPWSSFRHFLQIAVIGRL